MINFRMLVDVLRHSGFGPITCVFVLAFLICSAAVWLADPETLTFGEVVSTIGFGDVNATGPVARVAAVVLSVLSIFYIALLTGVVVSYCTTALKARQEGTLANFAANLERLDEMTPEELAAFSARVREYRCTR